MQIHVHNNGQQLGPFPLPALHEMVRLGSLPDAAVVWYEGAPDWIPLSTFLQQYPVPAAPATTVAAPAAAAPGRVTPEMLAAARAQSSKTGKEISDVQRVVRAAIAGAVAAIIGGAVWAGIAIGTGFEIGYVAWGIGLLCGLSISKLGRGNGVVFQVMAVICSLVGIAIGKIAIMVKFEVLSFSLFDILFVFLAIASAWKMAGGGED